MRAAEPAVELVARRLARRAIVALDDMLGEDLTETEIAAEVEHEWRDYLDAARSVLRDATDPAVVRLDIGPDGRTAQVGVRR